MLRRNGLRIKYGNRDIDPDAVDWSRNDLRNFDLVQPPGPGNVLGKVKFLFPNSHDVYMHDTTQKHLFANAVRGESHGCMRVQNPDQFAELLLKHANGWGAAQVQSALHGGADYQVPLDRKIPVYIAYWTLRVNEDGTFSTFNDLYGHDARMAAALDGKSAPMDEFVASNEVVAGDWRANNNKRSRQRARSSNDFTRALFGF